ncbi:hypothetical protein STSR3_58 [Salmonella virus STSR3]|nr:hypothetical protein STSR3_58 [Salmonella virus STSR3]
MFTNFIFISISPRLSFRAVLALAVCCLNARRLCRKSLKRIRRICDDLQLQFPNAHRSINGKVGIMRKYHGLLLS